MASLKLSKLFVIRAVSLKGLYLDKNPEVKTKSGIVFPSEGFREWDDEEIEAIVQSKKIILRNRLISNRFCFRRKKMKRLEINTS